MSSNTPSHPPPAPGYNERQDQAVISTADDAILAKLSSVERGYYNDPFIHGMARGASGLVNKNKPAVTAGGSGRLGSPLSSSSPPGGRYSRPCPVTSSFSSTTTEPIIRRGTHARVKVIDRAIDAFLSLPLGSTAAAAAAAAAEDAQKKVSRQIVVLGAGRDTTYLRHRFGAMRNNVNDNSSEIQKLEGKNDSTIGVRWYEVDHPSVIRQKSQSWLTGCMPVGYVCSCDVNQDTGTSYSITIASNRIKKQGMVDEETVTDMDDACESTSKGTQSSNNYHLIGHDLRSSPATLFEKLTHPQHGYDKSIPTLFVLECVMMYLPDEASKELLRYIAESSQTLQSTSSAEPAFVAVVIYDPIPSNDRFGQLMIEHLSRAGITGSKNTKRGRLHGNSSDVVQPCSQQEQQHQPISLEKTQTLSDQMNKLISSGFHTVVGCNMNEAYNHGIISTEDRIHASRCEMLDELEEFVLLMKHYCLLMGVVSVVGRIDQDDHKDEVTKMEKKKKKVETSVGFQLCTVGKDSLMGFQEGRCMVVHRDGTE